jgi:hypothetical protein
VGIDFVDRIQSFSLFDRFTYPVHQGKGVDGVELHET